MDSFGIAIDLGTTNVVARLVALEPSKHRGVSAPYAQAVRVNPQRRWGRDVATRLTAALEGHGEELAMAAHEVISELIADLVEAYPIPPTSITRIVVAGNTVMEALYARLDVKGLSIAPFEEPDIPASPLPFTPAPETGTLPGLSPDVTLELVDVLGGFVGGDCVAAALGVGFDEPTTSARMLIDIGTNTEILLHAGNALYFASTPAGPAFEGVGIACTKQQGAESQMDGNPLDASGLVMLLATLLDEGFLKVDGRLSFPGDYAGEVVSGGPTGMDFQTVLDSGRLIRSAEGIIAYTFPTIPLGAEVPLRPTLAHEMLLQTEIRTLQLAKAAILAGVRMVCSCANVSFGAIDEVVVAGAFGNAVPAKTYVDLGLVPMIDPARISFSPDAVLDGLTEVLSGRKSPHDITECNTIRVSLTEHPDFNAVLLDSLSFGTY